MNDDDRGPRREDPFDLDEILRDGERREREAAERRRALENEEIVRGPKRGEDGRFVTNPDRVCRTDGSHDLSTEEYQEILLRILHEIRLPRSATPVRALERARTVRELCEDLVYEAVAYARGCGWAWRHIGEALGISESGAHRRFGGSCAPRKRRPMR